MWTLWGQAQSAVWSLMAAPFRTSCLVMSLCVWTWYSGRQIQGQQQLEGAAARQAGRVGQGAAAGQGGAGERAGGASEGGQAIAQGASSLY